MFALLLACHKSPPLPDPPTLEERVAYLSATLEHERAAQAIPGMAIGVVVQGQVVLAQGFGMANVERGEAATAQTPFAVGSTTKAFTSALLASRVEAGELAWDDPVSQHIEGFSVQGGEATVRDLLSHSTGLTRMPMAWGKAQETTLEDLLLAASRAEPWGELGEDWHYNNVMVAIAGSLVGDYAAVLQAELLDPLGMSHSSLGLPEGMATGYRIQDGQPIPVQPRDLSGVLAPAGALTSTADDMLLWVQWQLAQEGEVRQTWEPVHDLGPMSYGMGWMVVEEGGVTVIEHGGNIEGFSAHVALLPQEDMGLVWMSNVMAAPLQATVRSLVVDAMLGDDWWMPAGQADLSDYVGRYDAAFIRDTLTVVEQDGGLALDVPGQTVYGLRAPDEEGLWAFKLTKSIQVEFVREEGEVVALVMHQGGLTMSAPKEGHIGTEQPPRYTPLLGRYRLEEETLEVRVVHGHLALDMPSQLVYGLKDPDEEGLWVFMETPDIALRFETDDAGVVTALTLLQGEVETRAERMDEVDLPPLTEVLALMVEDPPACREQGTIDFVHQGVSGTWVMEWDEQTFASRVDVPSGTDGVIVTREQLSTLSDFQEDLVITDPVIVDQSWADHPASLRQGELTLLGPAVSQERPAWRVLRDGGENPEDTLYIAQDNGDLLQRDVVLVTPYLASMRIPQTLRFYDHVDGVPGRVEVENEHTGRAVMTTTSRVCSEDLVVSTEALPEPASAPEPPAEAEEDPGQ